jgi:hypothetical protein
LLGHKSEPKARPSSVGVGYSTPGTGQGKAQGTQSRRPFSVA